MLYRPMGLVIDGRLEPGLEIEVEDGVITLIRPHTGVPGPYVISPAFVNGHSHLEYRGLLGQVPFGPWRDWIRALTLAKRDQTPEQVLADCHLAAEEMKAAGVAVVWEHSDRPGARAALDEARIDGKVFQEIITFLEQKDPTDKLKAIREVAREQWAIPNPHSLYLVDEATLRERGASGDQLSIHFAETPFEREFLAERKGPLADLWRDAGFEQPLHGSPLDVLRSVNLLRPGVQLVHVCDTTLSELEEIAGSGATIAHCPRSNRNLGCPPAKVRQMLDVGIPVCLGTDSAASSGPIDMILEIAAVVEVSEHQVTPEEAWRMATESGAAALGIEDWLVKEGSDVPLIAISCDYPQVTADLLSETNRRIEWLDGQTKLFS